MLAVVLALFAPLARAQDGQEIGVRADVAQRQVYVGDQVLYQITVEGADDADPPQLDLPPGVSARLVQSQPSRSESTLIVNGRMTREVSLRYVFQYELTVRDTGTLTIGPARVKVGGQAYTTNRVQLSAREPTESDDVRVEVELDSTDLWVGQTVRAHVSWLVGARIDPRQWSFDVTALPDSFEVYDSPGAPRGSGPDVVQFSLLGRDVVGTVDETDVNGVPAQRLTFDLVLSPTEPGRYDLGPIAVVFNQQLGRQWSRFVARADPIPVAVRALPAEGRPDGFTGLVGVYTIHADASADSANVGDPIDLRVRVRGDEPMPGVSTGPDLRAQGFADHFRLDSDGWERVGANRRGERDFSTTIRPLDPAVTEIPPVELPYFDVDAGEYRVARSDPIPLEVRAVREVTAADAVVAPGRPTIARTPLAEGDPAFWAEDRGPGALRPDGFDLGRAASSPAWIAAIALPPLAYAGAAFVVSARRRTTPEQRRRRRALPHAVRVLRSSGPAAGARTLVADLLDREPEAVTAADCDRFDLDDDTRRSLRAMLEADEGVRFGALAPSAGDTRRARDVFRRAARAGGRS